ncbi:arsenite methyltransferase isoform X2 [Lathamus discolor]|uniref:arsenite methyltransferase isoform X2 n=1 Tax=Lathamus discolor TaxID=678569 RepID=UPI0032B705EE
MAATCGEQIHREVQDYYGQELQKTEDLKTNACITLSKPVPKVVRDALERVHEEVVAKYYGCGLVVPECLASCRILDLGSGSGRDCYLLSQLVGEQGHVTGIDMTKGQVEVAKKHIAYHTEKFGYQKPNVEFLQGYMEKLGDAGLADNSYDIVISNCVINLAPDKRAVLQEAYRVLKESAWREPCTGKTCTASPRRWGSAPHALSLPAPLPSVTRSWRALLVTAALSLRLSACSRCREGEVVDVDAEMAAILRSSRFAERFLIQPGAAPQGKGVKEKIRDPFQLLEQLSTPRPACRPGGSCGPSC